MIGEIVGSIETYLAGINKDIAVLIISMLPIVELRGAIPFGVGMGMNVLRVALLSVIGNLIPVPFVIWLIRPILEWLKKTKVLSKIGAWIDSRTMKKSENITKYKMLGLMILVAIPLPGTGAWTGAMVAGLLNMRVKDSFPAIALGVVIAGILVISITYGVKFLFAF